MFKTIDFSSFGSGASASTAKPSAAGQNSFGSNLSSYSLGGQQISNMLASNHHNHLGQHGALHHHHLNGNSSSSSSTSSSSSNSSSGGANSTSVSAALAAAAAAAAAVTTLRLNSHSTSSSSSSTSSSSDTILNNNNTSKQHHLTGAQTCIIRDSAIPHSAIPANNSIASFYSMHNNHLSSSSSSSPIHQSKFAATSTTQSASFQSAPNQPSSTQQQSQAQSATQIDAGETDKVVGYGAFGVVWSVTDPRNGRRVALKKMPNVFQTIVSAKRVFREVKMLCTLKHDNVSRVHFESLGFWFILFFGLNYFCLPINLSLSYSLNVALFFFLSLTEMSLLHKGSSLSLVIRAYVCL